MAGSNSRARSSLKLGCREYRKFAEQTKAVGLGLNISTFDRMERCWGAYSPWALSVCNDATDPETKWSEHALITLAASIDADQLRAVGPKRPELDWSVLEDSEVYAFVLAHEIGHRVDNYDGLEIMLIKDLDVRDECHRRVRFINEVLADRYAWAQIRPGEPLPLSEYGASLVEKTAAGIAYMEKHAPRMKAPMHQLAAGQYRDVPSYMLATPERAGFVGPRVNPDLLADRCDYYGRYAAENRQPLF